MVAKSVLFALALSLTLGVQGRRTSKRDGRMDSTQAGTEGLNASSSSAQCPEGYGKWAFMENVKKLPEHLFSVFGHGMADMGAHQFMVWQARAKGSSTYGVYLGPGKKKNWVGLDYYFVKGPLCEGRCTKFDANCCRADKDLFEGTSDDSLLPHGNTPSKAGKLVILPPKFSATQKYSVSSLKLTFELEAVDVDGVMTPKAKIQGQDCYVDYVQVCESNGKSGSSFAPTKYDIVGKTKAGVACIHDHK